MELSSKVYGPEGAEAIVVLHGLLGASRNWQAAAQALADGFRVCALDLRNHGDSPWLEPHSYEDMVGDVLRWMDARLSRRPALVGHSMGGKVAMKLACEHPSRIRKLVVVDISPKLYPATHDDEFVAMRAVDASALKSRGDAEAVLEPYVSDWGMRKFLLTNLVRDARSGGFRWQINLDAIENELRELEKSSLEPEQRYAGEALFVMGGKSGYFSKEDIPLIRQHFPASVIEVIADSGHNPHFEKRDRFVEILRDFVGGREGRGCC